MQLEGFLVSLGSREVHKLVKFCREAHTSPCASGRSVFSGLLGRCTSAITALADFSARPYLLDPRLSRESSSAPKRHLIDLPRRLSELCWVNVNARSCVLPAALAERRTLNLQKRRRYEVARYLLGNYRFVGATDNIRKRGEMPASYFGRMKDAGINIGRHLLLKDVSANPALLLFDASTYRDFRDRRLEHIWKIVEAAVNPEGTTTANP